MAKNIPAKEFKAAVKALNVVLKEQEESPIKIVGVKKEQVTEDFTNIVLNFIEEDKSDELPDEVIEIYNNYIATDETDDDAADEKPKGKGKKEKKKAAPKGDGVVSLAVKAYMEDGIKTTKEITEALAKTFPGRNIKSTISNVVCVLNHVKK